MRGFTLLIDGRSFTIPLPKETDNLTLIQAVYLSGLVEPPSLCAGLGVCGRCRVHFLPADAPAPPPLPEDLEILSAELTEQGWRLACKHRPFTGAKVELPPETRLSWLPAMSSLEHRTTSAQQTRAQTRARRALPARYHDLKDIGRQSENEFAPRAAAVPPTGEAPALAVDFGTTSLFFSILEPVVDATPVPTPVADGIWVNPQMGAGAEVISRLAFAASADGRNRLAELSRAALRRMVQEAETRTGDGHSKQGTKEICLAANTAMTYLLLGLDTSGLAVAPYRLDYAGGKYENLPQLPPLWIAPLLGPFIGGDLSAGYAALTMADKPSEFPFLLADLGTNGEFILAISPHYALAASLPLGPALEGAGMRCGAEARPGTITSFALSPDGLSPFSLPGAPSGAGISGSGYMSLISHMLRAGLLRPDGSFITETQGSSPLLQKLLQGLHPPIRKTDGRVWRIMTCPSLYLAAADVETMLKIKAAFSLALKSLLKAACLRFTDLRALYLAGSLGAHVRGADLETMGFIPARGGDKVRIAGNTALTGAALLSRRHDLRPRLLRWTRGVHTLNLADQADFLKAFTAEMHF
ncbi:MAG: ASKHA domain-containing protein [Deltaproteobacteria bacterium]|jgi:uncharacterized 2Fe-2S/4Fe-4S cluster protein (DUF4445 family)|nr:ASKHA domain-containing protein [Deltaproteobacteria bacterium]